MRKRTLRQLKSHRVAGPRGARALLVWLTGLLDSSPEQSPAEVSTGGWPTGQDGGPVETVPS